MKLTHLALSGGGIKGVNIVGALQYLHEQNMLDDLKCILGTSVGSIIGALLSFKNVEYIIKNIRLINIDISNVNLKSFISHFGFQSKRTALQQVENLLLNEFGCIPTLQDLYNKKRIELVLCAINLNKQAKEFFSYKSHPDMSIMKAIYLSINIPFLFEKEEYLGDVYVDTGIIDNISWEYFSHIPFQNKMGIFVQQEQTIVPQKFDSIFEYMFGIILIIYKQTQFNIKKEYDLSKENIVFLNDKSVSILDFKQDKTALKRMLMFGYNEIDNYLKKTN